MRMIVLGVLFGLYAGYNMGQFLWDYSLGKWGKAGCLLVAVGCAAMAGICLATVAQ